MQTRALTTNLFYLLARAERDTHYIVASLSQGKSPGASQSDPLWRADPGSHAIAHAFPPLGALPLDSWLRSRRFGGPVLPVELSTQWWLACLPYHQRLHSRDRTNLVVARRDGIQTETLLLLLCLQYYFLGLDRGIDSTVGLLVLVRPSSSTYLGTEVIRIRTGGPRS